MTDVLVKNLYESLKDLAKGANKVEVLTTIAVRCMNLLEAESSLTGDQKKQIVVQVLTLIVADLPVDDTFKAVADMFITNFLPNLIDTIVAASKGSLGDNLRKKFETQTRCGRWFCS
jgi:hypothetical protein